MINNFSNVNSGISIAFTGHIFVTNPNDALDCSIVSNLLGPPISACVGEPVVLDATVTDALGYDWYLDQGAGYGQLVGENSATLHPAASGMYRVVVATTIGNIISDVQVGFTEAPHADPLSDITACLNGTTISLTNKDREALGAQDSMDVRVSYHRSQADAASDKDPVSKADYIPPLGDTRIYVRVASMRNSACYDASQAFNIHSVSIPEIDFPTEIFLCDNEPSVVIGSAIPEPGYDYLWSTGETTPTIQVAQEGTYTLVFGDPPCTTEATVTVVRSKLPKIAEVIVDDLQERNTVTVRMEEEGPWEYSLDGDAAVTAPVFEDVSPGRHLLRASDNRGCGSMTEEVIVAGFPTFFTPNGDGANDYWNVKGISALNQPVVSIFDRYGKLLKQLADGELGWDGTLNGVALPASDYWFKLSYLDEQGTRVTARYVRNHFALKR